MKKLSIIVPCFNEEGNIEELVYKIEEIISILCIDAEIILIDDGSDDKTSEIIKHLEKDNLSVKGVFHPENQGIAFAWKSGSLVAQGEYIIITDADLQYNPDDIFKLYRTMVKKENEYDIIQGWRLGHSYRSTIRYCASLIYSLALKFIFWNQFRDVKSGFFICRREVFQDMLQTRSKYKYLQHYIVVNALSKGYKLFQVPIIFEERNSGQSFINNIFSFFIKSLVDIPFAILEFNPWFSKVKRNTNEEVK